MMQVTACDVCSGRLRGMRREGRRWWMGALGRRVGRVNAREDGGCKGKREGGSAGGDNVSATESKV